MSRQNTLSWERAFTHRITCQNPGEEHVVAGDFAIQYNDDSDSESDTTNTTDTTDNINIDIAKLPISAYDYYFQNNNDDNNSYQQKSVAIGWTPKLKIILEGVILDNNNHSPLQALRGLENTIIKHISSYFAHEYVPFVTLTLPAKNIGRVLNNKIVRFPARRDTYTNGYQVIKKVEDITEHTTDYVSFASCGQITFPPPQGHNVNMMPFILGDAKSLPEYLRCYHECIDSCPIDPSEEGSICYLTVHESFVDSQSTQRRAGLHIEAPGFISSGKSNSSRFIPGREHHWGGGMFRSPDAYIGGIYFASNIKGTSVVYNALVDKNIQGIVDKHGNCEHLRPFVGPGLALGAGQLIWMTDRTPHEAIRQEEDGYRQFFRVVTSQVSHWYARHSTVNPNVPLPDDVIVVEEDKFK
jgi:hypothetical protein